MKPASHIQNLKPYEAGMPIGELQRKTGLEHIVKLASNENPFGPSPAVTCALAHPPELNIYPDPGQHDLRMRLAAHHGVDASQVALGNGSAELLDLVARVFCEPGDHVVFGSPSFTCYQIAATACQADYTAVALTENLYWDVNAILEAIRPDTKLLAPREPEQPDGRLHQPARFTKNSSKPAFDSGRFARRGVRGVCRGQ
ncbi:MAG: aminotransferase class I/II-fold pyridoxal phosphate-dependent enzyme [Polyangiales bacterium]